jgi:serine/threonine protein kinase
MKAIPHPLIVKIIDDFIDYDGHYDGHLCIVNDFYSDRSLRDYLEIKKGNPFSESEILRFLANIFLVVFHLHSRDIFHRNLKPGKFLMKREANGEAYLHLSDLGGATKIIPKKLDVCAHIYHPTDKRYHAPEKFNYMQKKANITKQNVWSIGVIAYEFCTFNLPFKGEHYNHDIDKAIINDPPSPIKHDYSKELKDLIN